MQGAAEQEPGIPHNRNKGSGQITVTPAPASHTSCPHPTLVTAVAAAPQTAPKATHLGLRLRLEGEISHILRLHQPQLLLKRAGGEGGAERWQTFQQLSCRMQPDAR